VTYLPEAVKELAEEIQLANFKKARVITADIAGWSDRRLRDITAEANSFKQHDSWNYMTGWSGKRGRMGGRCLPTHSKMTEVSDFNYYRGNVYMKTGHWKRWKQ